MDLDEALRTVGEFGRYQRLIFLGLGSLGIVGAFQMLQIVFVGAVPVFSCFRDGILVAENNTCTEKCDVFQYGSAFTSIVTEVCIV